jgi:MFS family permease
MDHLVRLREISSAELFMPAVCGFIISCKWTTFDIGVTMWMQEEFGYTIGQASLAFSCASFAYACGSPLAGSVSDCVPKPKRK